MVALLHPEHLAPELVGLENRPSRSDDDSRATDRPQLRLVKGGNNRGRIDARGHIEARGHINSQGSIDQARLGPATATLVMIGLVVLMAVVILRVAQGTPPAASWEGLSHAAYGSTVEGPAIQPAAAADLVYVVESGDTLWAIALELRPEADPRPIVDALADRNGGPALQIGQRLVVPASLLPN